MRFRCLPLLRDGIVGGLMLLTLGWPLGLPGCTSVELSGDLQPAFGEPTVESRTQPQGVPIPEETALENWHLASSPQVYHPETLYEYIDGEAEVFLDYDFVQLTSLVYRGSPEGELHVDIYDMGTPENAFGVYSVERTPDGPFVSVGQQGIWTGEFLDFWSGRYYVRVVDYAPTKTSSEAILLLGRAIAAKVEDRTTERWILRHLPPGYLANTGKYVRKNALGFKALGDTVLAGYPIGGDTCDVFVSHFSRPSEAAAAFDALREELAGGWTGTPGTEVLPTVGEEQFFAEDPFYDYVAVVRVGAYLAGMLHVSDPTEFQDFLLQLTSNLE